jgi:hypothetical protein
MCKTVVDLLGTTEKMASLEKIFDLLASLQLFHYYSAHKSRRVTYQNLTRPAVPRKISRYLSTSYPKEFFEVHGSSTPYRSDDNRYGL